MLPIPDLPLPPSYLPCPTYWGYVGWSLSTIKWHRSAYFHFVALRSFDTFGYSWRREQGEASFTLLYNKEKKTKKLRVNRFWNWKPYYSRLFAEIWEICAYSAVYYWETLLPRYTSRHASLCPAQSTCQRGIHCDAIPLRRGERLVK